MDDAEFEVRYRAVASRDGRFDGRFFTGVRSTGVYCRPICPARTPKRENVSFFPSAAAAVAAGFRACRRCVPEAAPASAEWDAEADVVRRALDLIAGGALDGAGVAVLAARLGIGARHLHRVLADVVGAGPLVLARTRRAQTARALIEQTDLPLTEIAFAAGYGSLRQFNAGLREAFSANGTGLRRAGLAGAAAGSGGEGALVLRLRPVLPFDGARLLGFLGARAVPGVEEYVDGTFRRSVRLPHGHAVIELTPGDRDVRLRVHLTTLRDLGVLVAHCRRLLDLDADPAAIGPVLEADPLLRDEVRRNPGLRIPGSVDPFEMTVRAVLGQQVSVAGARTLAGRLAGRHGVRLEHARGSVSLLFPTPGVVATGDLDGLGLTGARIRTLRALARGFHDGSLVLERGADLQVARAQLLAIPGVGPWTASYVAMRALGDPDAFPAGDLGLRRAFERAGLPGDARSLGLRAAAWRPWRAYAALHLWNTPAPTPGSDR